MEIVDYYLFSMKFYKFYEVFKETSANLIFHSVLSSSHAKFQSEVQVLLQYSIAS